MERTFARVPWEDFFFHDEANEDAVEGGAIEYELKGSLLCR